MSLSNERPTPSPSRLEAIGEHTVAQWQNRFPDLDQATVATILAGQRLLMEGATITTFIEPLTIKRMRDAAVEEKAPPFDPKQRSETSTITTAVVRRTLFRRRAIR